MLFKFLTLIIGILLTGFSLTFIIIYINLLSIGYTFINYVNYISRRWECLLIIPGVLLIIYALRKVK